MATEKRLIKMCDATKVYNGIALYMAENAYLNDTALDVLKMVADWLNEATTVDAVEVVRCKDCKHLVLTDEGEYNPCDCVCDYWMTDGIQEREFCSRGERRAEDDKID